MNLPPSDHVVWKLARLCIVGVIVTVMLKFNYANGWAQPDWTTLIAILTALGGFDAVKSSIAPKD